MVEEVLALLQVSTSCTETLTGQQPSPPAKARYFVDGTLGLGGHSEAIFGHGTLQDHILGIDRDQEALNLAQTKLAPYGSRIVFRHNTFDHVRDMLTELGWPKIQGMLLDLGVSSLQLDKTERGFSFAKSSALDMRMDLEEEVSARELLDDLPEKDLVAILRDFGEERYAKRIAQAIVRRRQQGPIETTDELRNLVSRAVPFSKTSPKHRTQRKTIHPATRVFQALRIAVNRELKILQDFLKNPPDFLEVEGVLVVLSYHSLEDRIVKNAFRHFEKGSGEDDSTQKYKVLTKKPLRPSSTEVRTNPRARSAKLRALKRIA